MSSLSVRDAFRAAWAVPGIPLVETINNDPTEVEVDVPIWATFIFVADESLYQTMGSSPWIEESGVVTVALFSYSGVSDAQIAQAAKEVRDFWDMWISPDKMTWVSSILGPRPPEPDAQGDTYQLALDMNYRHQYRGG